MARIVVVDDSKFIATALTATLEDKGHEVVGAGSDGNEGLELYKTHKPDLLLLDITMPNRDGRDCLEDVIKLNPDAKIIMISAIKEQEIVDSCLANGAKDFIQKPLQLGSDEYLDSFFTKINNALS